ncbi:MAG: hypothetical protein ABL921_00115, partial [Pirellula sp.]
MGQFFFADHFQEKVEPTEVDTTCTFQADYQLYSFVLRTWTTPIPKSDNHCPELRAKSNYLANQWGQQINGAGLFDWFYGQWSDFSA